MHPNPRLHVHASVQSPYVYADMDAAVTRCHCSLAALAGKKSEKQVSAASLLEAEEYEVNRGSSLLRHEQPTACIALFT